MVFEGMVMSGLPGAGKSTLLKRLQEETGWAPYSIGDLIRERYAKLHPEQEITFEEYWRNTTLEQNRQINIEAREIFAQGEILGDSRYSIYCQDLPLLLIFIQAPLDVRAERGIKSGKYNAPLEEVINTLEQREKDEVQMGWNLFDYDYRNPENYHMVLNTGMLTVDEELEAVTALLQG